MVGIGITAAGGYVGYKYGQSSGINRFLATADDYEGLVSEEELAADVEEELVGEDDEFGDYDVENTEGDEELNVVKKELCLRLFRHEKQGLPKNALSHRGRTG